MNIKDIKAGDTVKLVADRNTIDTTYTGVAKTDYKADCGNPGVSLKMPNGKLYYLTDGKHGLHLTSWRACSLITVAQYGYFI